MRKLKEILRLHHELVLARQEIGRSLSISHNTVADVIRRTEAAGLSFPLPGRGSAADMTNSPPNMVSEQGKDRDTRQAGVYL